VRDYLTRTEIETSHADQIERYGGAPGIRDQGQLEAALHRPQTGYYTDIIAEAAALWESLSQNHPFIDGNKRTALAAAYTFLAINSMRMTAEAEDLWGFLEAAYSEGSFRFEVLDDWLRRNTETEGQ